MTMIKTAANCRVVMYNSDVDDKIKKGLQNVNETWSKYDCVICNSVITCGVNYDMAGFDKVFMFLASFYGLYYLSHIYMTFIDNHLLIYENTTTILCYIGQSVRTLSTDQYFQIGSEHSVLSLAPLC